MTRIDMRGRSPTPPDAWRYHALLNGEDVSARCFLADDVAGEVGLYRQRDGAFYVDEQTGEPAQEFVKGTVVLIPPE